MSRWKCLARSYIKQPPSFPFPEQGTSTPICSGGSSVIRHLLYACLSMILAVGRQPWSEHRCCQMPIACGRHRVSEVGCLHQWPFPARFGFGRSRLRVKAWRTQMSALPFLKRAVQCGYRSCFATMEAHRQNLDCGLVPDRSTTEPDHDPASSPPHRIDRLWHTFSTARQYQF